MKKLLTAASLLLLAGTAVAQKGLYLKPIAGIGLSNAQTDFYQTDLNGNNTDIRPSLNYRLQAGIGYTFGKWSIESGIEYFRTGYTQDLITTTANAPLGQPSDTRLKAIYGHIGVPVLVSYRLKLAKRLAFEPALGLEATYNLGRTTATSGGIEQRTSDRQGYFSDNHQRISFFGVSQLHLSYQLTNRLSLIGGFSGKYMLGNLLKEPDNAPYDASQRNYLVTFDLGIKYRL